MLDIYGNFDEYPLAGEQSNYLTKIVNVYIAFDLDVWWQNFSINFTKVNTKFCLSLHCSADNSYLLVNAKEIFKFKPDNENVNFLTQFGLRCISNGFSATESGDTSKWKCAWFSVDYNSFDKNDILNIYKNLMIRNNKQISHAFLFFIRNYSPEVINIQWRKAELNIILQTVNNLDIKHGIFALL